MSATPRVIIIGGGIGGLSMAIALQRGGIEARGFERMSQLREVGSGLNLWTNAMRTLERLGLDEAVRAKAAVIDRWVNLTSRGQRMQELPLAEVGQKYGAPNY